ncbi:MAG: tRNA guanosine(34) transglycosylase Tgt [Planctomycetota bacterium]
MSQFTFELTATDGGARAGVIRTAGGEVPTPVFMPVGTQGTVKCLTPAQVRSTGAPIILANAYHLMLRPGVEVVAGAGGLRRWSGWNGPMLTDSGGYQLFSLAELAKVSDEGVSFRSHIDGTALFLSPAEAVRVQNLLAADIIMPLDDCVGFPVERFRAETSVRRTVDWALASKRAHERPDQALFGIVQGSTYPDLRRDCADRLVQTGFAGYAIGGVSVGEGTALIREVVGATVEWLPEDRPRYLMGVGPPKDLLAGVAAGVDMFDCVIPTRNGRNGWAFTAAGTVKVKNSAYARSDEPLEAGCDCYTCGNFARSYLRHLFNAGEILGMTLVSLHNLRYFARLMEGARKAIAEGNFGRYAETVLSDLGDTD